MEPAGDPLGLTDSVAASPQPKSTQQKQSADSPKPFDASLFDNFGESSPTQSDIMLYGTSEISEDILPQQSLSAPELTTGQSEDSREGAPLTIGIPIASQKGSVGEEDGYESQPIGSPGGRFQLSGSTDLLAEGADSPQPVVSGLFGDDPLAEAVTGQNLEGKNFFDSFTSSGGELPSFITPPQSLDPNLREGSFNTPPQSLASLEAAGASPSEDMGGMEPSPQHHDVTSSNAADPPQSLTALEGQLGLITSVDLGSDMASPQLDTADEQLTTPSPPTGITAAGGPPRELFSTLSLEEDDNQGNAQEDTQSIDLLLDQPETGFEAVESSQEALEDQGIATSPKSPDNTGMTLLEQSKLATGNYDPTSGSADAHSEQKLDNSAGVIHSTGPHSLSPQSPQGIQQIPPSDAEVAEQKLQIDTTPTSGIIHNTGPHPLVPQSPADDNKLPTPQQSPVSSESSSRGIFSPLPATSSLPFSPTSSHPFSQSTPQDGEDPFAAALSISESDRRHDAWLPSEATQRVLVSRLASLHGTEYVDRKQLTMPGVIADEPQGDPLKDLVYRYMGEAEATQRKALTVNQVTRDREGLKRLLDNGCIRAAVDLTALLLTPIGQGKGQHGLPSKHTPESLQIWFIRLAILIKLQQYTLAETECEAFGNMDQPDLYFEYYPDLYPGRKGSMVPFSLRVLHAEMPQYTGKHQEALNRLYNILGICNKIVNNLDRDLSEFGTSIELTSENKKASLDLWKSREVRVLYCIGNCLLAMKDYNRAANVYEMLCERDAGNHSNLLSAIGRIYLQLGDLKSAQAFYQRVEDMKVEEPGNVPHMAKVHMNKAFLSMAENQYGEASEHFEDVLKVQPENFTAINNISVCLLYMGRLKEALTRLESMVQSKPESYLDEALLFNLCTLYELESSRSGMKKQSLLGMVSKYKGDGFNVSCLKMM